MKRARPYDRDTALEAAMTLFWRKGYHATSLKDLEQALQMKPGSIYAAFESKDRLFALTLQRYFEQNMAVLKQQLEAAPSPLAALFGYLKMTVGQVSDDLGRRACMLVKTLLNATPEEQQTADMARAYLDEMQAEIENGFILAQRAGEIPDDVDTARLARRYQAALTQLRIEAHRGADQAELDALVEEFVQDISALTRPGFVAG